MEIKNVSINNYPILDACCGGKMFYFDKHDPRVLFQDIRNIRTTLCDGRPFEVSPDVTADFTDMPYEDESFSMVVFDPPHLKYTGSKKEARGYQMIKYGSLPKDWREMLAKGFSECFRVLRQGGFLIFKWNETDIKVSEVLKLTTEKPVFGHISGKRSKTHWICFMKNSKKTREYKCVALFGYPFLFQNGDLSFHENMAELGLSRGNIILGGLPNRCILANKHEYFLIDYYEEHDFCEQYKIKATYSVKSFIQGIKELKSE